jgi:hypothetical protein
MQVEQSVGLQQRDIGVEASLLYCMVYLGFLNGFSESAPEYTDLHALAVAAVLE